MVAALAMVGFGAAWHVLGSVVAGAQYVAGAADEFADELEAAPLAITPPPATCSGEPPASGPCPVCTSDVPGASDYENSLPVPTPAAGFNYVVQLVNESDVTLLAAANAAHQGSSTPNGPVPSPVAVLPREGTWVMLPKGSPNNGNILTIDIPPAWEGTECPQTNKECKANGPRFFARTGCKYDPEYNLAQCETGSCGDAYDCGLQALRVPPLASSGRTPVTIVEWTFNSQGGQGYNYPDISLVDGISLTADVQALGPHCESKPGAPTEPNWLSQNQPLAIHGADLRDPARCIPSFRLTRGEVGQLIQGQGNPDEVVACFSNCGRYEYPSTPDAMCDPTTDQRCKNWLTFCCFAPAGDPNGVYGGACTNDSQCAQSGGCWNRGDGQSSVCACRAFLKNDTCAADVCTHPNPPNLSAQPPFGRCSDVSPNAGDCIGDDTVHAVFPGGYTWPNDPQTYPSDARAYRVIFAPGGTSVPITDSGGIPFCSAFPPAYGYDVQAQICKGPIDGGALFGGAALSPTCTTTADCPVIPGSRPSARYGCDPFHHRCATWSCDISPGGPVSTGAALCRWKADSATPTPTPTRALGVTPPGGPPPTSSSEDDGCAIAPHGGTASGGLLVVAGAAFLIVARRRAR
ncbi:MAG: hypothetical protein ACRERC_09660 [Candidatus Binatia bacterium]